MCHEGADLGSSSIVSYAGAVSFDRFPQEQRAVTHGHKGSDTATKLWAFDCLGVSSMICRASQSGCREALWHKYDGAGGGKRPSPGKASGWLDLGTSCSV